MNFFRSMIDAHDTTVDSIVVGGLTAMLSLCGIQAFDVMWNHHEFSALAFGSGAGTILTGLGLGKMARDNIATNPPAPAATGEIK